MKTLFRFLILLCLTLSATATPELEGQLRALISEAREEIAAVQKEQRETAAALGAALEAKAAAQVRADVLADQARANAASATKSLEAYRHAVTQFDDMHESRNQWRLWCAGLALSVAVYLGLRLHPFTRAFIP